MVTKEAKGTATMDLLAATPALTLQSALKSLKLKTKQQEVLIRVMILCLVYVLAFITRLCLPVVPFYNSAAATSASRWFPSTTPPPPRVPPVGSIPFYNSVIAANKQVSFYDPSFLQSDSKIRNRDATKRVWRTK
nr:dolichyl-diphosphooligosaccharide--protein glycosyltransferase subunit STT3B [Ipomoea batatas]